MSLTLGSFYLIIASHRTIHRQILIISIPIRLIAAYCFWQGGPKGQPVAIYELTWAVLNASALPYA